MDITAMDEETFDWYNTRPTLIKKAIEKLPEGPCYKMKDNNGHYSLNSITESLDTGKATLKMVHLPGSYLSEEVTGKPTAMVFGVEVDDVLQCGCMSSEKVEKISLDTVTEEEKEGVEAIKFLQGSVKIKETDKSALRGWRRMYSSERQHTLNLYRLFVKK